MNVKHPTGALHSFSIKNIFYDKMDLTVFYFYYFIFKFVIWGVKNSNSKSVVKYNPSCCYDITHIDPTDSLLWP